MSFGFPCPLATLAGMHNNKRVDVAVAVVVMISQSLHVDLAATAASLAIMFARGVPEGRPIPKLLLAYQCERLEATDMVRLPRQRYRPALP